MPVRYVAAVANATEAAAVLKAFGQPIADVAGVCYQRDVDALVMLDPDSNALKTFGPADVGSTAAEIDAIADLSANGAIIRTKRIQITSTPTGAEQDTGFDLPAKAVLLDCFLDVTTLEATGGTKTMDVGLLSSESGGDADGFLDGVSVAAAGVKIGSLVAGSVTRGVLLKETVTDSGAATHASPRPHNAQAVTARSVSYTAGSNDFAEFRGAIILVYAEVA